jgi:hypothetical protein
LVRIDVDVLISWLSRSSGVQGTEEGFDGQDFASAMSIGILGIHHLPNFDLDFLGRLTGDSQTHINGSVNGLSPEWDRVGMLDRVEKDDSAPFLNISVTNRVSPTPESYLPV